MSTKGVKTWLVSCGIDTGQTD